MTPHVEIGDWVVFAIHGKLGRKALGGPWSAGQVIGITGQGFRLGEVNGPVRRQNTIVARNVHATFLSRGEAIAAYEYLESLETRYLDERDRLKPTFLHLVKSVLERPTILPTKENDNA